jgi:hypothetical protein
MNLALGSETQYHHISQDLRVANEMTWKRIWTGICQRILLVSPSDEPATDLTAKIRNDET